MKLTIFAKNRTSHEGKKFTAYVTKLTKKNGEEITAGVRFREECGAPKADECPCYVIVDKKDANLNTRTQTVTDENTGEEHIATYYTMWVKNWKMSDEVYEDHSLDDFE